MIYDDVVNNIHVKNQILSGAVAGAGESKVKQIYQSMQGQPEREKEIALILAGLHDFWTVGGIVTVRFALLDDDGFQIQDFSGPSLDIYSQDEFLQVIYY